MTPVVSIHRLRYIAAIYASPLVGLAEDLASFCTDPQYDEDYKLEWDPRLTEEFFRELDRLVDQVIDFAYGPNSPLSPKPKSPS